MRAPAKQALAAALILSSLIMLLVTYYTPIQEAYHPINTDWNGCSQIAGQATNATHVRAYGSARLKGPGLLSIVGPGVQFSEQDALRIKGFLQTNGTVLLADDFGTGNSLLQRLNVSVRFSGKSLADLAFYSKSPSFPIISDFADSPVTTNVTALMFNHPSFLEIGNYSPATVLGFSSHFSFVDLNGTARPAQGGVIQPYPVIASVQIGNGSLVVVSDASMFTNEMIGLYDNARFWENVLRFGGGALFFDEAHLYRAPFTDARIALKSGVDGILNVMRGSSGAQLIPVAVVASVMMVAFFMLRRRVKTETFASR